MYKRTTKPVLTDSVVQKTMHAFSLPTLHTSIYIGVLGKKNGQSVNYSAFSITKETHSQYNYAPIKLLCSDCLLCNATYRSMVYLFTLPYQNTLCQNKEPRHYCVYCLIYVYDTINHMAVLHS